MLYDHNNEYMLLRITLKDLVDYYDVYNDDKRMNFKINDELSDKIYQSLENIFEHIGKNSDINLNDFTFEEKGENYFKTKVTDETCFKEGKVIKKESDANFIPKKTLRILVEHYYKYNLFSLKLKIKNMT